MHCYSVPAQAIGADGTAMVSREERGRAAAREPGNDTDTGRAIAQLERALEADPDNAEEWCRLGELYQTLASSAPANETANGYRDKAIVALTRAISLRPGLARAHFALAD